ncbi:DUF819 family protein [Albibacterium indicum]|uniref:DUF819 family protein n=1 Tax=Albibacterium indicum TaxID=2292082 RepID=UPI000E4FDB58|nr:DUF819 family protein [Pedobacter indicus]
MTLFENVPLISNDAVVFGLLMIVLGLVFYTSSLENKFFKRFYVVIPPLLLCYFVPGLFNSAGIISGSESQLYDISASYLLPACLVLFTLSLNLSELWKLRKKAGVMFLATSLSVMLGGPFAVWVVSLFAPEVVGGEGADEVWRGLSTLAGSWIGGGANQAALYRIFEPSPELFSATITVDVFVAYGWMAILLYGAGKKEQLNRFFRADDRDVQELVGRMEAYSAETTRVANTKDYMIMLSLAFGVTGIAHLFGVSIAEWVNEHAPELSAFNLTSSFFWIILIATILGICLSFTKARNLEGAGASKLGTVFLYILIAAIGTQMNILSIFDNLGLIVVGLIWMLFHVIILVIVGRLIRAPFFFVAVSSMSNIGGVASSSVTAAAFHPSLVSVGVILSVCAYAIGTYAGYVCGILMQMVSP